MQKIMICKTTQRNRKELFFVALPRRQNNVALSPPPSLQGAFFYKTTKRSQGAIYCRFVKATKQCRFERPPLPARRYFWSLWQRDKETFLWGGWAFFKQGDKEIAPCREGGLKATLFCRLDKATKQCQSDVLLSLCHCWNYMLNPNVFLYNQWLLLK